MGVLDDLQLHHLVGQQADAPASVPRRRGRAGERDQLRRWAEHKPLEEFKESRYQRNALTVDGQPGLIRPDQD